MAKRKTSKPPPRALPQSPAPSTLHSGVLAGAALIVVVTAFAYFPSLRGGFILDDDILLTDNALIKAADGLYRFWCTTESIDYWPVANTSLWIEWRLWGMNPTGYHVTNLVLHIVEALLIWVILQRLSIPGAFLAALLFAVHPVNVETVAWIAQRKGLLAMLFFLLSILWYLRMEAVSAVQGRHSPPFADRWYWLSLVASVLAMLSKGSAAVLPVVLLLIMWWLRPLKRIDVMRVLPFFLVAVVLVGVNVWFQGHLMRGEIRHASVAERLLGAGGVVWFYLYKAILPVNLAFLYPQWHIEVGQVGWWVPLLAAVIVTGVLWWYRLGWSRSVFFAWVFFCVALLPVTGLTDVGFMRHSLVADHYQHVALIGVMALVAACWGVWQQRGSAHWIPNAVAIAAVGALIFLTSQQSRLYVDASTLYRATLEKNPKSWLAHNNLGLALSQAGRLPEAIEQYEQALRLKPDYLEAHTNLGNALVKTGRLREAIEHYEQALRLSPDYPKAHVNLGNALATAGRLQEAVEQYEWALRVKPDDPDAHYSLGNALTTAGRPQEAVEQYELALRVKPDYAEAYTSLGNALATAGRTEEAIAYYEHALRLQPNYPEAHYNLGSALARMGRVPAAIEQYKHVIRLTPDDPEAWANLAFAYGDAGKSSEAINAAQKALDIARSKGQTAVIETVEEWLNGHRAMQPDTAAAPPSE